MPSFYIFFLYIYSFFVAIRACFHLFGVMQRSICREWHLTFFITACHYHVECLAHTSLTPVLREQSITIAPLITQSAQVPHVSLKSHDNMPICDKYQMSLKDFFSTYQASFNILKDIKRELSVAGVCETIKLWPQGKMKFNAVSFRINSCGSRFMQCMYVCMYLLSRKRHIAQKDHIGAKIDLRARFMGKYK